MYNPAYFLIYVTAVYNTSHVESAYTDSAYNPGCGMIIGIEENTGGSGLRISPNPFSQETTLHAEHPLCRSTLTVYDSFGRRVKQIKNISGETIPFSRELMTPGVYFISVTEQKEIFTGKLLIIDP